MNEHEYIDEHWQAAWRAGIFHAIFRLLAIADLYGPERAMKWAQALVDDPALLSAFAHTPERPIAEITVRRLGLPSLTRDPRAPDFPSWN